MKLWAALTGAGQGWVAIIRGHADWRRHFALSPGGLASALVIYFFFAFLAIAFGSMSGGMPGLSGVMLGLLVQGLSILALLVGIVSAKIVVRSETSLLALLVPGIYGLVFYLLSGTILASVSTDLVALALLLVLLLLCRLGQVAGRWALGVALAFAVFTTLLLVAMPLTLYMLTQPAVVSS